MPPVGKHVARTLVLRVQRLPSSGARPAAICSARAAGAAGYAFIKSYVMTRFRCYLLNPANKIVSVDSVEAETDAGAVTLAGQLISGKYVEFAAIEIWDRARFIDKVRNPTPQRKN
jgi:hypothetical protein